MAEPNDQDRLDADRFLTRYGAEPRDWERRDLIALIAELRERYTAAAIARPEASTVRGGDLDQSQAVRVVRVTSRVRPEIELEPESEPAGNTGRRERPWLDPDAVNTELERGKR